MQHLSASLWGAALWLLGLVGAAIGVIEAAARRGLAALGITGAVQTALLLVLLLLLIVGAFRLFGRLIAILVALALLVLLLHAVLDPSVAGSRA